MSDWIEQQADKIKQDETRAAEQRRWELHVAEQVKQQWEVAWRGVLAAVRDDVHRFNAKFESDASKQLALHSDSNADRSFMIRRDLPNGARVLQVSAYEAQGIDIRLIVSNYQGERHASTEKFPFGLKEGGNGVGVFVHGTLKTPAEAAESILKLLF